MSKHTQRKKKWRKLLQSPREPNTLMGPAKKMRTMTWTNLKNSMMNTWKNRNKCLKKSPKETKKKSIKSRTPQHRKIYQETIKGSALINPIVTLDRIMAKKVYLKMLKNRWTLSRNLSLKNSRETGRINKHRAIDSWSFRNCIRLTILFKLNQRSYSHITSSPNKAKDQSLHSSSR